MRTERQLRAVFHPGERLVWRGWPRGGIRLQKQDQLLIPFSLAWCGMLVFAAIEFQRTSGLFVLALTPFALLGVYILVGRFIVDAWDRRGTIYGLTDRRVLIIDGLIKRQTRSLPLDSLPTMVLSAGRNSGGTISFGEPNPWSGYAKDPTPAFAMIDDPRHVYCLIQDAKAKRSTAPAGQRRTEQTLGSWDSLRPRVISDVHNNPREGVMLDRASLPQRLGDSFRRVARRSLPRWIYAVVVVLLLLSLVQWIDESSSSTHLTMRLLTGSENRNLRPIIDRFAEQENVTFEIDYKGSVDTMLTVKEGAKDYDAVWPASSIWLSIGDTGRIVEQARSIMATPVVFAVKKPVAERLGWVGRDDVTVEEILAAAESGQIRYMTTSATQSNSGAMAYFGYLYAFAGQPDVLTSEMLRDPAVVEPTKRMLNTVDRSAAASGFLADLFYKEYDAFDGMVNNESAVITTNQKLIAEGRDPLYAIYPVGGLAIADWQLGFIDRGDAKKAELFVRFQAFLLSDEVQAELLKVGRRTGINLSPVGADPAVFNPDWGIDLNRPIVPITPPSPQVIKEALVLYQTVLRKPSFTVFALDFSGSMEGDGERDLTSAMRILLDPEQAARYFLQPSTGDITVVIPFNDEVLDQWRVDGNDPAALRDLLARVTAQETGGDTNIYDPVIAGLDAMAEVTIEDYSPAVILVTDGRSNDGSFEDLEARIRSGSGTDVPVYAILFGDASESQLTEITEATTGRIFDGQADLIQAIRTAKGYN